MPRFITVPLVALAVALASPSALAQPAGSAGPTLGAGTRIRVTAAPPITAFIGAVVTQSADTLVFRRDADGSTVAVPVGQVSRLDMSGGTRTHKLRGATIGLLAGVGIGALLGLATGPDQCTGECLFGPQFAAAVVGTAGGVVGALVGTLIGARSTEIWNPVPSAAGAARIGIAPTPRGGVALTASLAF